MTQRHNTSWITVDLRGTKKSIRALILLCAALMWLLYSVPGALAQDAPAQAAPAVSANAVNDVAKELWCPLCSGVRLDACELKACEQMKEQIAGKLAAGEDLQSIKNYFVGQYGPQVLGEPPMEGFNWLAWLLPVAVLVGGGLFLWSRARRMVRPAPAPANAPATPQTGDPYDQKLEEELKHYD